MHDDVVISAVDQLEDSSTTFTLTLTVPTESAPSVRHYLSIPAFVLGADLLERRHDWWSSGGQVITHSRLIVGGETVGS